MKRVVLAIRNRLVLEAVTNALKRAGFFVEKSSSQEPERILTLTNALAATTLVMDVTRSGDGTFDMRMDTAREVRRQNPEIKLRFFATTCRMKVAHTKSNAPRKTAASMHSSMNPSRPTILQTQSTHFNERKRKIINGFRTQFLICGLKQINLEKRRQKS